MDQNLIDALAGNRKRKGQPRAQAAEHPIAWTRADPAALARFDPDTKRCLMNCGPHRDDPRSADERKLLCDDCLTEADHG